MERVAVLLSSAYSAARHPREGREVGKYSKGLYFSDPECGRDEIRLISKPFITAVNWGWRATRSKINIQAKTGAGTWHRAGNQQSDAGAKWKHQEKAAENQCPAQGHRFRMKCKQCLLKLNLKTCSLVPPWVLYLLGHGSDSQKITVPHR